MAPSLRAAITVVFLYLVYRVYAAVVSPWTTPLVLETAPIAAPRPSALLPSDAALVAKEHLPHAPWAADAEIVLHRDHLHRDQEGFVYFNESRRIEDGRQNRVRFTPFALVWFDPRRDDRQPYTITCGSAVIEFKEKFDPKLGHSADNRIVGGQFGGEVRIAGPDGLLLVGRAFTLSEGQGDRGLLYSERRISFAYGPVAGQASQIRGEADRFDMTLITGDDSLLGKDMPRIGGIKGIVLRENVSLEMVVEEDGRTLPVSIRSDGRFEYDVENRVAEFNDNVQVARPTHRPGEPEQFDRLTCDKLSLVFEPKPAAEVAVLAPAETQIIEPAAGTSLPSGRHDQGIDFNLQLRALWAIGQEVVLTSDENELHGTMGELFYNVSDRSVQMLRDEQAAGAEVRLGSAVLVCPDIWIAHDEQSRVRSARCNGAGQAWQTNRESGEVEVEAGWNERLTMAEDPESGWDLLELVGEARVVQRQQELGVLGDVLRVWFDSRQLQASQGQLELGARKDADSARPPLHRVVAEQTGDSPVLMVSRRLQLKSGRVEADFVFAEGPHPAERGKSRNSSDPFAGSSDADASESPVLISAGAVRAAITIDPATNRPEVSEITATTDVRVSRDEAEGPAGDPRRALDDSFYVECETLGLTNDLGGQILRLLGAPAFVRLAEAEIEGRDILVDRDQNYARVNGPGTIGVDVGRDLEGRTLETPERLRVRWQEQMDFDGESATFLGKTVTTLADSVMKCHQMVVTLSRRISFADDDPHRDDPEVSRIHCRDMVTLEYHKFSEPAPGERAVVLEFLQLEVAEFHFEGSTGDFSAVGPGKVEDWQRRDGRRRVTLSPQSVSRANQAAEADDLPWDYTWLRFSGELKGNQLDRWAVLQDRVEVIHGPVQHPLQPVLRGDVDSDTETAKNTVWLQSDQMNLLLRAARAPAEEDWLEVVAVGNAEMEGKVFRARADTISYDQSKEQFTLKGRGTDAAIYHQPAPGQPDQRSFARTIQFVPAKRKVELEESSGLGFVP